MEEETVRFRVLELPCCRARLLWIEQAPPKFCPECGAGGMTPRPLVDDPDATLTYESGSDRG